MHPSSSTPGLKRAATVGALSNAPASAGSHSPAPVPSHSNPHSHAHPHSHSHSHSHSPSAGFNLYHTLSSQFRPILDSHVGLKSLLMDLETTGIISMFASQSSIISHEVYLTECIDVIAERSDLHSQAFDYCKAIVFIQPSKKSLSALKTLLQTPRYQEYHIYFTSIATPDVIDQLAAADSHDLIKSVKEFYSDYYVLSPNLFHLNNIAANAGKRSGNSKDIQRALLDRDCAGLLSLLLSLKRRPDIRFADSSDLARVLATRIQEECRQQSELFAFHHDPTLLLILDRRDDCVTPLLNQWTYQAMIHELIGIQNNRIDMKQLGVKNKEMEQLILSPQQDAFFRANQFANFGEMGMKIKALVAEYQAKTRSEIKMETMEDMQRVIENFPEFRQMSGTVSKHVQLMSELGKIVSSRQLMTVSAIEQEIVVCNATNEGNEITNKVLELLERPDIQWEDKLRVVLLWALRFEGLEIVQFQTNLKKMKETLKTQILDDRHAQRIKAIDLVLEYGGISARRSELFKDGILKHFIKAFKSEIKGVENIYTQHKPLLAEFISKLTAADLKLADFPFVDGCNASPKTKYKQVIIFITGGVTFEEYAALESAMANAGQGEKTEEKGREGAKAAAAAALGKLGVQTANRADVKFLLGGSFVHNSQSFLQEINPIQIDLTRGKMRLATEEDIKLDQFISQTEEKQNTKVSSEAELDQLV